jgi:hypothetical protein
VERSTGASRRVQTSDENVRPTGRGRSESACTTRSYDRPWLGASATSAPGNLPAQMTSFVGRRDEIAVVSRALDEARLVTLTGAGGVGKTRLAIHAAAEVLPAFSDGAWFCELAAAGDPDAMVQVVAAALGVQPRPEVPLDARVREVLRDRELLVVLDNCEHGPTARPAPRTPPPGRPRSSRTR